VPTIVDAIQSVLKRKGESLTVEEVYSRIVQANLYQFRAIDPKSVVRAQLRRHCINLDFPSASPVKYFALVGEDRYTLASSKGRLSAVPPKISTLASTLPEEVLNDAYKAHLQVLRDQLKEKILQNHPAFFERMVIQLLIRMGYGGSDPTLGIHTGGPGDGGIDGIIKEDKLGLEQIYIQAKRYALSREVSRAEVQRFAGAMNKVKKGVFITTAKFATNARVFAQSHEKTISLIDGDMLSDLMIMHGVGVSEVTMYRVLRIDNDFFSPDT
jgi:restriction system protein